MSLAKAALVVNPVSANGLTRKRWPEIASAFEKEGLPYVYSFTEAPGHATELTLRYLKEGYKLVVSVGGDGTANEVINGFFTDKEAAPRDRAFGYISTGTGGDLGRTIGTPRGILEAVQHLVRCPPRPVDVGRVTFINNFGKEEIRYFINVAGLGLDGDIVDRVNRTSKALGGFFSFLWGTVVSLLLYQNQNMAITVDDKMVVDEPITFVAIGNGCYFGGGMKVAPNALMDDGFFDIIILQNLSKIKLLLNLHRVYRGTHLTHPLITSLQGRKITVNSKGTALLNLDGEQPGRAPAEIELLPQAINLKG